MRSTRHARRRRRGTAPSVRRLFEDFCRVEREYFRRTPNFPDHAHRRHPQGCVRGQPLDGQSLLKAFNAAQRRRMRTSRDGRAEVMLPWLPRMRRKRREMGDDYWPYGLDRNRHALQTFLRYSYEQGLSRTLLEPEQLFAPETLERFKDMTMIVDAHGHYTTVPPGCGSSGACRSRTWDGRKGTLTISDDEIRASLENGQLRLLDERGIDVMLFSPMASAMGHHFGNARSAGTGPKSATTSSTASARCIPIGSSASVRCRNRRESSRRRASRSWSAASRSSASSAAT